MSKVMWTFKTKNFKVEWIIDPDELDTRHFDSDLAKACKQKVRSGEWKCFMSEIRVSTRYKNIHLASEYLGQSIYAKPEEFRDHFGMNIKGHGSYFSQMVRDAIHNARKEFSKVQQAIIAERDLRKSIIGVELKAGD